MLAYSCLIVMWVALIPVGVIFNEVLSQTPNSALVSGENGKSLALLCEFECLHIQSKNGHCLIQEEKASQTCSKLFARAYTGFFFRIAATITPTILGVITA